MRALSQPRRRSRAFWAYSGGAGAVLLGLVIVLALVLTGRGSASPPVASASATPSPPSAPVLASLPTGVTGQTIDGIQCEASEQVVYHIHAHLAIYVNGTQRGVPEGIGIPAPRTTVPSDEGPFVEAGKCYYWLHTHTNDGIIHIESPTVRQYTLGNFFDIWQQPLTTTQVGPYSGTLIVYVNGQRYSGDPRNITLGAHELIQLDVNGDVPPTPFTFPATY